MKTVGFCYFGTRGGAPRQLLNLVQASLQEGYKPVLFISHKNELLEKFHELGLNTISYEIPGGFNSALFNFRKRGNFRKKFISDISNNNIDRLYYLMPHPWDCFTYKYITKLNVEVWRGVHDSKPHPGDFWPNRFTIMRIIKNSDVLVAFSKYVANKIKTAKPIVFARIIESEQFSRSADKDVHQILVIGRMKKYKNLKILNEVISLLPSKYHLVVAGLGSSTFLNNPKVEFVDHWLDESEIESLIDKAGIVLLPYREASQSGVIPLATSRSTPVVVTPVGGLDEQIVEGVTGLVASSLSAEAISLAIQKAEKVNWPARMQQQGNQDFIKKLFS